jgi:hypothetical protein
MSVSLYEKDFNLWLELTIKQLESHEFTVLDTVNLIEELKDLGKAEKNALWENFSRPLSEQEAKKLWFFST